MTTTIRLDPGLKKRLDAAARKAGLSPHALMVEAISSTVTELEADAAFEAVADARWKDYRKTGTGIPLDEARRYVLGLARGKPGTRPRRRALNRRNP
jgi:predicted transcriptional regulator